MPLPDKIYTYWNIKQQQLAGLCCLLMFTGFLFSRALLSIGMIAMVLNTLHPKQITHCWLRYRSSPFAFCCLVFFAAHLFSGLWSANVANWAAVLQIKLPFLFMPFALFSLSLEDIRIRNFVFYGILLILTIGMLYSLHPLLAEPGYLQSHLHLPSPVEGDYIRFTMALVCGLQLVLYELLYQKEKKPSGRTAVILALWSLLAVFYIHFQAAKSGLVCFYILVAAFLMSYFGGKRLWIGILILAGVAGAGIASLFYVPLLQKQLRSIAYEKKIWEQNDTSKFANTSSFVPRLISYEVALGLIGQHPLTGFGAGDLKEQMDAAYIRQYPAIQEPRRIIPHNQFICTALALGIPLSLLSLVPMALSPLKRKQPFPERANFLVMCTGLMIEPMLETQYGIFVYLFFTLLWMRVPQRQATEASTGG